MAPPTAVARRTGVAVARRAAADLCEMLGLPLLDGARPGAVGMFDPAVLLRAADGWVHPGPPTAWADFATMVATLHSSTVPPGRPRRQPNRGRGGLPDVSMLSADAIDREAEAWMLPVAAVRAEPTHPPEVRRPRGSARIDGASVVVLGSAWAAPLAGLVLRRLGAEVVRVTNPRRPDPFPLRDALARDQAEVPLDLGAPNDRDRFEELVAGADLLVDGTTPRVLRNVGLHDPGIACVRIAAFVASDRPGYGIAAEAHGGWAARNDPPRLGRSSVADPIAGLLAALLGVDALTHGDRKRRERISLEDAVGHLLGTEARGG